MNQLDFGHFSAESIESAAKCYKTLGFSIIPLYGARNPAQAKLPLIKWSRYQHCIASDDEITHWFEQQVNIGIGIVCGRVSRLVVLDFDDAALASEFRRLHPELVETFTVRSGGRGLPHYYFRLPADKLVASVSVPGADLRGEGTYVVGSPTRAGDMAWRVEYGVPPRLISDRDLRLILGFLSRGRVHNPVKDPEPQIPTLTEASEFRRQTVREDVVGWYERQCGMGRNSALFNAAVKARDAGMPEARCCLELAPIHASKVVHKGESYKERFAEALRTIASAYSRPARSSDRAAEQLGNAAREWLMQHDLVCVARVLDGLYQSGLKSGAEFTEAEACQRLAVFKIGRRSVMAALQATVSGALVFERRVLPPNPLHDARAAYPTERLNNSCGMSRGAIRVINGSRGRPARQYRLPTPVDVARLLKVDATAGDAVTAGALSSAHTYRAHLHMKLLERRPGQYGRVWLATRVGVSRWTVRRYEKSVGIVSRATFSAQPVTWTLAGNLPEMVADGGRGVFLETADGKRYPAIRGLAFKLLKDRKHTVLKHQLPNFYETEIGASVGIPTPQMMSFSPYAHVGATDWGVASVGIPTPQAKHNIAHSPEAAFKSASACAIDTGADRLPSVGIPTPQHADLDDKTLWLCPTCLDFHVTAKRPIKCYHCGVPVDWEVVPRAIWTDGSALKLWWQERYRSHHRNGHTLLAVAKPTHTPMTLEDRTLAERVRARIPDLSFSNARQAIKQFGSQLVEKALTAIEQRCDVRKPAGFLLAFLRSEQKLLAAPAHTATTKPKRQIESHTDWLRRLVKSQYASFMANADDLLKLATAEDLELDYSKPAIGTV